MSNYSMILTKVGLAKVTNAQLTNENVLITHFVVGDGNGANYVPTQEMVALKNEKWRGTVSSVEIDKDNPHWIIVTGAIPAKDGGFMIREAGLIDKDGDLVAIGNTPETYKPLQTEGAAKDLILKQCIEVSNAANVTLQIDPTVIIASRDYVNNKLSSLKSDVFSRTQNSTKNLIAGKRITPQVGIIDDDGCIEIMTKWLPILQSGRKFALDIAVITDKVGKTGYCTWEQLETLKETYPEVVDLINHSHTHPEHATLSEAQLEYEFSTSFDILSKRGHTADVYVYPYGSVNELTRKVARRYTRAAFWDQGGSNSMPMQQFQIRRTLLMDTTSMPSLDTLKSYVDNAIVNNHLLFFMSHSQFGGFDVTKVQELIDYINTKVDAGLIEWVNAKDAIDNRGNILDIGDYISGGANGYKIIDALGRYHSNDSRLTHFNSDVFNSTPLTDFQYGITYSEIFGDKVTGFPGNTSGLLETYRDLSGNFSHQRYRPYATNQLHQRIWNQSTGEWRDWDEISVKTIYDHTKTNSHLATDYRIAYHTVSLVPDASATDLPHSQGGTLETYRLGNDVYTYQTFKPRGLNKMFTRRWSGSAWSEWLNVNGIYNIGYKEIALTLEAKKSIDVELTQLVGANNNIIVSTVGGLEAGVMYSVYTNDTKAFVRLYNITDDAITINRNFKYNLLYNS